jgi:hypothetical protein
MRMDGNLREWPGRQRGSRSRCSYNPERRPEFLNSARPRAQVAHMVPPESARITTNLPRICAKSPPMTEANLPRAARLSEVPGSEGAPATGESEHDAHSEAHRHARRRARLIARLPARIANAVHWLLRPESRWARIPAGLLLMLGGCLSILPILGLWMLPLGIILIAEDAPPVRRQVEKVFDWMERRWPRLFSQPNDD